MRSAGQSARCDKQPAADRQRTKRSEIAMNWLYKKVIQLQIWKDEHGQDLVEYALAAGMVAVAAVAAMPTLSTTVQKVFDKISTIIDTNVK
jgi:pilus assembly protein Flp/PilA